MVACLNPIALISADTVLPAEVEWSGFGDRVIEPTRSTVPRSSQVWRWQQKYGHCKCGSTRAPYAMLLQKNVADRQQ